MFFRFGWAVATSLETGKKIEKHISTTTKNVFFE
jgi:hypothetical protein